MLTVIIAFTIGLVTGAVNYSCPEDLEELTLHHHKEHIKECLKTAKFSLDDCENMYYDTYIK